MNKQNLIIFSLSAVLFLAVSFIVYSWTEPGIMPSAYTPPLNSSASPQTKLGALTFPIMYDSDDCDAEGKNCSFYINPSGNSVVSGTISAANPTENSNVATKEYVDQKMIEQKGSFICINKIYKEGGCFSCDPGHVMLWVEENGYYYYPSSPCNISYSGDDVVCSRCTTHITQMKLRCCYVE